MAASVPVGRPSYHLTEGRIVSFDYVIVGAGSAGAALAARLSADPTVRVLLLEAGPADRHPAIAVPAAFSTLFRGKYDWAYQTAPQPELGGRSIFWPRGRTLGGSSSLNAMMWVRGFAADYDAWAAAAGPEWSWQAILPYFSRVERTVGSDSALHGRDGAVSVEPQRSPRSHTADFLRAAEQAGYSVEQPNSLQPNGFCQTMVSQRRGRRCSTADAYLRPARRRPNLVVRTGAQARRVLIEDGVAVGVECDLGGGRTARVRADREVVLCGGAVNTPQLLQLSGIGDGEHLSALGIPVLVDRPAVGGHLLDHLVAGLIVKVAAGTLLDAQAPGQVADYLLHRRGMLTSNVAEAYGFVRSDPALALPDIEVIFAPVAYVAEGLQPPPEHAVTVGSILLQPRSSGTVRAVSPDPLVPPEIDPRYLSDPADRATMLAGLAVCEQLLTQPALRHNGFLVPAGGDEMPPAQRDGAVLDGYAHTLYHPVGTARMGLDDDAVVDAQLRVRGVGRLRVADASVMPTIIRGHTNAPAIVIGERAADLLRTA